MWSLALLGPVILRQGGDGNGAGTALPLPTQKSQALLVLLALDGPTHRARLAQWLWPDTDDSSARRNLRRELARLRDAGAAAVLVSDGDLLRLAPALACDVLAFKDCLAQGRFADALTLWHGDLADGLQPAGGPELDQWLAHQRASLRAGRRQALEGAAQWAQARGDMAGALDHLQALLADDPLQEHHHRALMQLHADCGRREAALAQFAQCREWLAQELGVAPTAETHALAARLRSGELGPATATATLAGASTALPTVLSTATPADTSTTPAARPGGEGTAWPRQMPLVGRSAAWAQLQAAWDAGRVIVIQGDGGIGKSRLACDFAASHGAYALAQCRRSDAGVPYASFTRALRQLAGPALAQADLPGWVRLELAHVLPELGHEAQRIGSVQEQRRFFEACAAAWQALSAGSFDAIVIDDWHLADDASRALLGFIAEQRRDLAGTASNASAAREIFVLRPELDAAALARLRALLDSTQALHLVLPPLAPEHVYELVRQLSGAPAPHRFAQRLERATGGNPFFVAETLRQWLGLQLLSVGPDGIWQTPFDSATQDYGELPVPDSVRDAVIARVQRQSDMVRRLLEAAALATEPFTPTLLAGACGLSEVEALGAIEDAMAAELLREREGGYGFAHDLVQAALDSALAPERRRLGHRRLALGAQAAGMAPADIAQHWEAGGEPQRAVPHRIAAAEAALALYADAEADRHWQAALADRPTLAQQMQILGGRWRLLRQREDQPGLMAAVVTLDTLGHEARATPGAGQVAQDAAVNAAEILALTNRSAEAVQRLRACLADPALGVALRAQALRVLGLALSREGRTDEARQATEQALAAGGLTPLQQGGLLHALSYTCFLQGQPGDALRYARRALVCWQSAGARRLVARAHASIGRALDMLDEQQPAWAELERAYELAAELKLVDLQREVANNLANNRVNLGEPARAIAVIQEAWALSPHFAMPAMPVFYLGILVQAHYQLGELGQALSLSDDALARAQALGEGMTLADCATMTLPLHTLIGDHAGAARRLAALQGLALEGLAYIRVKLAFSLVLQAVQQGDLQAARAALQDVGDIEALQQPPDRAYARLRHAQVALAAGQAEAALQWLQPLHGAPLYAEARVLSAATRLAAHTALGQVNAAANAAADALLLGAPAQPNLPALPALHLLWQRRRAATLAGDAAGAALWQRRLRAAWQALHGSLAAHPAARAAFAALWGPHAAGD